MAANTRLAREESSARRVTFTQLVPESLRNDTLPLPPEWTDEEEL